MAIVIDNISFSYGDAEILSGVSFSINPGDKVGLVGDNGSGKTTLLNIICGGLEPDGGSIGVPENVRIGYVQQGSSLSQGNTVLSEMKTVLGADRILERMKYLEKNMGGDPQLTQEYDSLCAEYQAIDGYNMGYRIRQTIAGLGFGAEYYDRRVEVLSGGEKTKLAMAKLLVSQPDLLVLDEPTNHLDIPACEWLKDFLKEFRKSVLIVSHDGGFLDAVCNRIVEIKNHRAQVFAGNFSAYRLQKQEQAALDQKRWRETSERAKKLSEYVERNLVRASTSNMAKSRRRQLEKLDLTPPESQTHERIVFRFPEVPPPYKELIKADSLGIGIKGKRLFTAEDFLLLRNQNLAIMGGNGTGKTTLLKTLLKKVPPDRGSIAIGAGARISYYEQNVFKVESRDSMSVIRDRYPAMTTTEIRTLLAGVGLRGDEVFVQADRLSGGERARLMLCLMSLEKPNVILLDEPTNHLDAYSKQILTDTLVSFTGTVIAVSHDIEFINALGCRILYIENGRAAFYENLAAWRARRPTGANPETAPVKKSSSQKNERREKALKRQERSLAESEINRLEAEIAKTESEINSSENAAQADKLAALCEELEVLKSELDRQTERWLTLEEELSE